MVQIYANQVRVWGAQDDEGQEATKNLRVSLPTLEQALYAEVDQAYRERVKSLKKNHNGNTLTDREAGKNVLKIQLENGIAVPIFRQTASSRVCSPAKHG